jgi:toxin ParE1/3/4
VAEIRHSVQARADLRRIWDYIAQDNAPAADRLLFAIEARIVRLATFPQSAPARDDIRPGCRMLVVNRYRVLYEFSAASDVVEIIAVVEPYRDTDELF